MEGMIEERGGGVQRAVEEGWWREIIGQDRKYREVVDRIVFSVR